MHQVTLGDILIERKTRYKPNEVNKLGLKRIEKIDFSGSIYLSKKATNTDMILVIKGDLVISGINAEKGAISVYEENENILATIHYSSYQFNKDQLNIDYFKYYLKSKTFKKQLLQHSGGGIKTELKAKHLLPISIYLPKIEQQEQIVNKIKKKERKIIALLDEINNQLDYFIKIHQSILQEAVQGKLVSQDPNDEQASELLKKIKAAKEQLIREGKIKKEKPLEPIKPEEMPYQLPKSWIWCQLKQVTKQITDGEHQTPPRISLGKILLSAKNVRNGFIDYDNCDYISESDFIKSRNRCCPEKGDLLIVSVGGTIGRTSLVSKDIEFALVRSVALIKPILIYSTYLRIVMESPLLQKLIADKSRGGAQPCLYLSEIQQFIFPLPPLNEQKRIVEKVDKLLQLCDELEEKVKKSQQNAELLMQSVLQEAFTY